MKTVFIFLLALCLGNVSEAQTKSTNKMKLNAGIVTARLSESKAFYTGVLNFGVSFENDFYLLLHTPDGNEELSFLIPDHPSQQPLFQKPFEGRGIYLTIEVEEIDKFYWEIKAKNVPIVIDIRDEPWGDRHFAITDPSGVGIDIVRYAKPDEKDNK